MTDDLTGLVAADLIRQAAPRVDPDLITRLLTVHDLSATVSDVLDAMGVHAALGASELRPTMPGRRIVGTAVTVRKIAQTETDTPDVSTARSDIGEIEGANQAGAGDVLVIQGVPGISAMGGIMAAISRRQGVCGAVVDGGVRDVARCRELDFPLWSSHVTPVTGKWRTEVAEINGPLTVGGRTVLAGDLVVADETGVVFVPSGIVAAVVEAVEATVTGEEWVHSALGSPAPLGQLVRAWQATKS